MLLTASVAHDHLPTAIHLDATSDMTSNDVKPGRHQPVSTNHPSGSGGTSSDPDLPRHLELLTGRRALEVGLGIFVGQVVANLHQCDQLLPGLDLPQFQGAGSSTEASRLLRPGWSCRT
jgi:hypothetical protein